MPETEMWNRIKESATTLFGCGQVEFTEQESFIIGEARVDQGFKDPRLFLLFEVLQEGLPKGGVVSIHRQQPKVIFIAGADKRIVSEVETQRGFREAA